MTKLVEWLIGGGVLATVWLALLSNHIENSLSRDHYFLLLISPIILVALLGLSALVLVLYRTFNFNDCNEEAESLLKEIAEAKSDLKRLGFKFKEVN